MTNQTLLAAVHAAANEPASVLDAPTRPTQENSMAGQNDPAPAPATITSLAALRTAYPDLCASLATEARAEGAVAEGARITGIDTLGKQMKGHDTLIAEMKADGKTTPEQAAVRIIAAEGSARDKQLQGVKDVETLTGKVPAAPQSDGGNGGQQHQEQANTPEGWKAAFAASAELQQEFGTAERYEVFKRNEGKVRFLRKA